MHINLVYAASFIGGKFVGCIVVVSVCSIVRCSVFSANRLFPCGTKQRDNCDNDVEKECVAGSCEGPKDGAVVVIANTRTVIGKNSHDFQQTF
jgi:hypothetical protein